MSFRLFLALIAPVILIATLTASAQAGSRQITHLHLDAAGSVVAATNQSGAVIWREDYSPYGDRLRYENSGTEDLWFTGKHHDEQTGLSYLGARWYDPVAGRFMAMDPAPVSFDDIHSFNRFAYANNNPYRYIDPDGRRPLSVHEQTFLLQFFSAAAVDNIQGVRAANAADYRAIARISAMNAAGTIDRASREIVLFPDTLGNLSLGEGQSLDLSKRAVADTFVHEAWHLESQRRRQNGGEAAKTTSKYTSGDFRNYHTRKGVAFGELSEEEQGAQIGHAVSEYVSRQNRAAHQGVELDQSGEQAAIREMTGAGASEAHAPAPTP